MKTITLKQTWLEFEGGEWEGSGFNEPEGYELLEVTDTDKHGHPIEATFVLKNAALTSMEYLDSKGISSTTSGVRFPFPVWIFADVIEYAKLYHAERLKDVKGLPTDVEFWEEDKKRFDDESRMIPAITAYETFRWMREKAAEVIAAMKQLPDAHKTITQMCKTWDHSYGAPDKKPGDFGSGMFPDEKKDLYSRMKQVYENDVLRAFVK